jgi:hypothetical protein
VPTDNLGICHEYHKWVHLGARHPVHIWCSCGSRAPNAASCRGRGIAMELWGWAPAFQPGRGQWSGDTYTVQESGDGLIGEPPQSGKWPRRIEYGSPSAWRTLHSQDPCARPPGGTYEGPECYILSTKAHKRIPSGILWANHAGDPTWCGTTTGPRYYPKVIGCGAAAGWTWVMLDPESWKSSLSMDTSLLWKQWLRVDQQSVLPYRFRRGLTDSLTPITDCCSSAIVSCYC